jgi:catechol 2,3-dioxygenase-like lactoylglutathione lyase family enzyme
LFSFPTCAIAQQETGSWVAAPRRGSAQDCRTWVVGELFNTFPDAGDSTQFNYFVTQPLVNYNFGRSGWALASSPILTYNFDGDAGDRWSAPLGLGILKRPSSTKSRCSSASITNTETIDRVGVKVVEGQVNRQDGRRIAGVSIYVRDPDGNLLEFIVHA